MLFAGFGRRDISPDKKTSLVGYSQRLDLHGPGNAGLLDSLYVRTLALGHGNKWLLLISFDLCVLSPLIVHKWREYLAQALALPVGSILLATTHTHSGPNPRIKGMKDKVFQLVTHTDDDDIVYADLVLARTLDAARQAVASLKPHTAFWNYGALGLGYNRRVHTSSGIQMCWNPEDSSQLKLSPSPDPHCGALTFRDEDGGEIVSLGPRHWFRDHPDGNAPSISPDRFLHRGRRRPSKSFLPNCLLVFSSGSGWSDQ